MLSLNFRNKIFSFFTIKPSFFFYHDCASANLFLPCKGVDNTFSTACEPKTTAPDIPALLFQ